MIDDLKKTTRIVARPKVKTDDRGRTVWADTIKTANLELVSTQMLRQILSPDEFSEDGEDPGGGFDPYDHT